MDFQEYVFNLKLRIAALESQRTAAETELNYLKGIRCPACNGTRTIAKESQTEPSIVNYENCPICNGTGFASGAQLY